MPNLLRRLRYLFHRDRHEADLAEEMDFHRAMLTADFPGNRPAASRVWGNATLAREDARGVWIAPWIESFWQDLAYGIRGMRREPGFTAAALGALAIAIGLNTSLFTVFNAVALRPWPVKDPARVVRVMRLIHKGPEAGRSNGFGVAEWRYLSDHVNAFTGLFLTRNGERVRFENTPLSLTWVTANFFSVLGVDMARGRGFLPEEDRPQAPQAVAVLGYSTWRNRFGADPTIVGKDVRLDDVSFTVVGVAPESFTGTDMNRVDFWAPFSARRLLRPHEAGALAFLTELRHCCSSMAGRLAPGYTAQQGAAEVTILMGQVHGRSELEEGRSIAAIGTALIAATDRDKQKIVPAFAGMFVAMTLVLLLACANVGNLLLARAAARRTEMAVRLSLGGSRLRLVRQLLVESLALAFAAAAVGLALAAVVPGALMARLAPENAIVIRPDLRVCAYTAALAVLACVVFGLAPALHGTGGHIAGALKRESPAGHARLRLRTLLLAAQVAISVVLLAGAGLLVRGVQRAGHQDPGFRLDRVTIASLELPAAAYSGVRAKAFTTALQDALAQAEVLPNAAVASDAPMANSRSSTNFYPAGEPARAGIVQMHEVSGAYFDVLGIPIVAGRNFTSADAGRKVAVLNQTAARRWFGSASPVGRNVVSGGDTWEVVGVARDAFTTSLDLIQPTIYWPVTGRFGIPQLLIDASSQADLERIAAVVHGLEPKGRVTFAPLANNFRAMLEPARYAAILAGILGLLALSLAGIGMAGVFAYTVRQRTREIGVRMALGAHPGQVVRLVLGSNLRAVAWGMAAGFAGAFAAARLLQSMMNGISPFDPVTAAGVLALLAAAASAASALPARRAARIDPLAALRWE